MSQSNLNTSGFRMCVKGTINKYWLRSISQTYNIQQLHGSSNYSRLKNWEVNY